MLIRLRTSSGGEQQNMSSEHNPGAVSPRRRSASVRKTFSARKRMSSMPSERVTVERRNLSVMPREHAVELYQSNAIQTHDKEYIAHRSSDPIHMRRVASCIDEAMVRPCSPLIPTCEPPETTPELRPRRYSISPPSPPSMMVLARDDILALYAETPITPTSADGSFDSTVNSTGGSSEHSGSAITSATVTGGRATLNIRELDSKNADALAYLLDAPELSPRMQRPKSARRPGSPVV